MSSSTPEEVKAEYASSLADLTFNSKPLINVLTMLAEENLVNAKMIVEAIEEHLAKVPIDVKLPILYLIDCIVKNVGQDYSSLFSQNIVSTFCNVFKMVDEKTRLEMFKLRQTWNEVFPQMKLYAIDVQIHQIDPAWPVTAQPSTHGIHLNPKFLKTPTVKADVKLPLVAHELINSVGDVDKETLLMQEEIIKKQKELLELQKKTLELEVLQSQVKLQEQIKAGSITPNILLKPGAKLESEASAKTRPIGISNTISQRGLNTQPKINPVNSALASARPIRDPRLLRKAQQNSPLIVPSSVAAEKSALLESNKIIPNQSSIKDPKDPRLSSKVDKKSRTSPKSSVQNSSKPDINSSDSKSRNNNLSSGSSTSLSSSSSSVILDSPTKRRSKNKKRDKSDSKRSRDYDGSTIPKREKNSQKDEFIDATKDSSENDQTVSSFKSVKSSKSRNYIRRNVDSPTLIQDEDLRVSSADKKRSSVTSQEKQKSPEPETLLMDVDLRQIPIATNKRISTDSSDQPSKKTRSFDVLFGSEDTDLRLFGPKLDNKTDRPPTPPPPPIISNETPSPRVDASSPSKSDLDAVRAKLANATSREKVMSKSFHKNRLLQSSPADRDLRPKHQTSPKIVISPEEEKFISSGNMTEEQQQKILNKIFTQIERVKLIEAKRKDHDDSIGDLSLQTISDDDLSDVDERKPQINTRAIGKIPPPPMPFNDKDERLNVPNIPRMMPQPQNMETIPPGIDQGPPFQQFQPRGEWRSTFRGPKENWRGRGRMPMQGPHIRGTRPWMQPRWRGPPPNGPFSARPEFPPMDDDTSRSPGQDGSQEITVHQDELKTLTIDGQPRDIRIYNETAVIFLSSDDPRQITFQAGARRVIFNNNETYMLHFNEDYKECLVNGYSFRVKLGIPSREIFINDIGFECFFGGPPININVSGINLTVSLEGPSPQVTIGTQKRSDLVVGKINLIINAKLIVPVFLDGKVQKFTIDNEPYTLKFVDALKRALINDEYFNVEFGGLPKPITINGKKHFIRFSVLPKGVKPGFVKIKDMEGEEGQSRSPVSQDVFAGPLEAEPMRPNTTPLQMEPGSPDNRSSSPGAFNILQPGLNNFDLSNVLTQTLSSAPSTGYNVESPQQQPATSQGGPKEEISKPIPALNINELFKQLVASGFVKTENNLRPEQADNVIPPTSAAKEDNVINGQKQMSSNTNNPDPINQEQPKPQRRALAEVLKPVTFNRPQTLKIRQAPLYSFLYSGMQCSSCGMRFPPEASMWYSQHLDWHFRQNRRGKKNARVANSRKWYYSLADWKNYEELEDLEEREKNYFDQQQQAEGAEEAEEETEIPTVPADPGTTNESCCVCRDSFDQFFNEDKEEWHLRNAVKMEGKTYHPVCYNDYQQSILEETLNETKEEPKLIPGLEIILDDDEEDIEDHFEEIVSLEDDEESKIPEDVPSPDKNEEMPSGEDSDDDDVILNEEAPIRIVVEDDDDDEAMSTQDENSNQSVNIKEEGSKFDDGFVDVGEIVNLKGMGPVTIKPEPMDDEFLDKSDAMDTSSVSENQEENPIVEDSSQQEVPASTSQAHHEIITSIDGNIELVSNIPTTMSNIVSAGPKIKINISKPLSVITPKDNENSNDHVDVVKCSDEPVFEEPEIIIRKPALKELKLKKQPVVHKGSELSGLCSIM